MLTPRFRPTRSVARPAVSLPLAAVLAACTVGSEEDTRAASTRELGNAASRISVPLSNPVRVTRPANEGGGGSVDTMPPVEPPVIEPPTTVTPPVGTGETVLDRLQTRFGGDDDADFWACVVFSPETAVLAYNFVGNIGASVVARIGDDAGEPVVRTYVATVTDVSTLMLDFQEVGEAEELSQVRVTGSGSDALLDMVSSTWGPLACSIANSGDEF